LIHNFHYKYGEMLGWCFYLNAMRSAYFRAIETIPGIYLVKWPD